VAFTDYEMIAGKRDSAGTPESGQLLRKFYDAVVRRDFAAAETYVSDNLEFEGVFETYRSAKQYLQTLSGLMQITVRLEVREIIAHGDNAAIFFDLQTRAPAEGKVLVAEWHRFKDGKIVHARSAFDARPYAAMFAGTERT